MKLNNDKMKTSRCTGNHICCLELNVIVKWVYSVWARECFLSKKEMLNFGAREWENLASFVQKTLTHGTFDVEIILGN